MKIIGIIPSRYASSRFPGKPLIDLKGKTMIQRVYEGATKCPLINKVIVATDDERIAENVHFFGGEVMMTGIQHNSGTERCIEVINKFVDFDVVINIQGDEPLVNAEQLSELINAFEDPSVQIATLGIKTAKSNEIENPNRIKIAVDKNNNALYFSRSVIPYNQLHIAGYSYLRHIGLYAFRTNILQEIGQLVAAQIEKMESLEQLRWLYHGYKIRVVETKIETPNIDSPYDVENVLRLL
jgi:3-deoxy-manno-octulosonate cytidylyltransferase (CMP-KDO synthetase)